MVSLLDRVFWQYRRGQREQRSVGGEGMIEGRIRTSTEHRRGAALDVVPHDVGTKDGTCCFHLGRF